ncbi:Anoctamin-5 [Mortierella sp. GBA30]|nr:Anoctamin-5 [Mortierella sp. GBA30]
MDVLSRYKNRSRRRKHDGQQLSPRPHMPSFQRGSSAPPSPSSPATTTSLYSGLSRHSSVRRTAVSAAAAQAAAAVELADQQNLKVISRSMSSYRVVHLLYQTDADLFDAIQEWKDAHPTMWVDDAIDAFATARGSDALAQLVYSTEAFDIVLKYTASHQDIDPIFDCRTRNDRTRSPPVSPQQPLPKYQLAASENEISGQTIYGSEPVTPLPPESTCSASSVGYTLDPGSPAISSRPPSRLSQLRQSPAKLFSKAISLCSPKRSEASSPQLRGDVPLVHPRPISIPHVSLPMSSTIDGTGSSNPPLRLLEPLDCSTDLFPSLESSTQSNVSDEQNCDRPAINSQNVFSTAAWSGQAFSTPGQGQRATWSKKHKINRPTKAKMRDWKIQLHRREYQLALLKEGLFLELEKSVDSDAVYVKVLAPFWRLAEEAQKTNCKADLAPGLEQRREAVLFKTARLTDFHLAEPGRRWSDVVRHAGAAKKDGLHVGTHSGSDGRPGFFQTSRRGYLVHSIMMRTESKNHPYGRKMGLRSALRRGAYQKLYPLHDGSFKLHSRSVHDANYRAQLRIKWARKFWRTQPLDLVNAYYGERIGVYFAWLGHYTKWLTLPAAVGTAVFVFGIINAARLNKLDATPNALFAIFDNVLTMPFALFMSMWSTVYMEFWKRANQYYAFRWNMSDYERVELPRTEFRATKVRVSPVTGKRELYYPLYWKALRIFASSIAVLLAVTVVVGSVACLMIFKAWCRHHIGGTYATVVATAVLNLIIIIILGEIWCRLAEWLTDNENHKYTDAYEDSLIIKRYLFDFTNMYATLFYYAFFKAPFGGKVFKSRPDLQDACLYDACITELTVQLAVVFIGKQFLNGLFEMVFPWMKRTWNRKKILADKSLKKRKFMESRKRTKAPQWVKDDELPSYQGQILKCYRKTGMWQLIMEFVSFTSVITNAAIIAFSSLWVKQNIFVKILHANEEGELLAARLGFILVFEHVVFLFKIILRASIPNVPLTIKLAVQRSKYMTRVANEGVDSEIDEDLDLDTDTDDEGDDQCEGDGGASHDSDSRVGSPSIATGLERHTSKQGDESAIGDDSQVLKKWRWELGLQRLWNGAAAPKEQSEKAFSTERPSNTSYTDEDGIKILPITQENSVDMRPGGLPADKHHPRQDEISDTRITASGSLDASGSSSKTQQNGRSRVQPFPQLPPLNTNQQHLNASPSQRRPTPQRASTDMDGEWVVLKEARM